MVFFTDWKSIGCGKAVTRYRCSSSFIAIEVLPCRMVGRMLQPHDNYSYAITEALQVGVKGLGSLEPFQEIDPLIEREGDENSAIFNATEADIGVLKSKYLVDTQHDCNSGSDSEWENGDETDFERNAFDAFDDEPDL